MEYVITYGITYIYMRRCRYSTSSRSFSSVNSRSSGDISACRKWQELPDSASDWGNSSRWVQHWKHTADGAPCFHWRLKGPRIWAVMITAFDKFPM